VPILRARKFINDYNEIEFYECSEAEFGVQQICMKEYCRSGRNGHRCGGRWEKINATHVNFVAWENPGGCFSSRKNLKTPALDEGHFWIMQIGEGIRSGKQQSCGDSLISKK
jgi:hypothetical protein